MGVTTPLSSNHLDEMGISIVENRVVKRSYCATSPLPRSNPQASVLSTLFTKDWDASYWHGSRYP